MLNLDNTLIGLLLVGALGGGGQPKKPPEKPKSEQSQQQSQKQKKSEPIVQSKPVAPKGE
jgi:iron only hydrogenase large subunit-like protein